MSAAPKMQRSGSAPLKRPPVRRPSLRDELNLVAIRYEKTSQGTAPIPIATINPIRSPSRPGSSASGASSPSNSPVVVRPPQPGSVPPPTEEHPALRQGSVLPRTTAADDWKRDSGHAPACSSTTPTINEEECEDDFSPCSPGATNFSVPVSPVVQQHGVDQTEGRAKEEDSKASAGSVEPPNTSTSATVAASDAETRPDMVDPCSSQYSPLTTTSSEQPSSPFFSTATTTTTATTLSISRPQSTVETTTSTPSRKLGKTFSLRSASSFLGWTERQPSRQGSTRTRSSVKDGSGRGCRKSLSPSHSRSSQRRPLRAPVQVPVAAMEPASALRGDPAPESANEPAESNADPTSTATISTATAADGASEGSSYGADAPKDKLAPVPASAPASTPTSFWKRPFTSKSQSRRDSDGDSSDATQFSPLEVSLPTQSLLDDDFLAGFSFSKRGSVMFGGQRALALDAAIMDSSQQLPAKTSREALSPPDPVSPIATPTSESPRAVSPVSNGTSDEGFVTPDPIPSPDPNQQPSQAEAPREQQDGQQRKHLAPPPDIRVMEPDVNKESQKVRSLYAAGEDALRWEDGALPSRGERPPHSPIAEASGEEDERDPSPARLAPTARLSASAASSLPRPTSLHKKEPDLAGGFEDYDDLEGGVVDRYGFINPPPRPSSSRLGTPTETRSAHYAPRRKNVLQKRDPSGRGPPPLSGRRPPSRKVSAKSLNTHHSGMSTTSLHSSRSVVRQAGNLLPYNRERRWMDEAGDMLTVSPSLQDLAEEARVEKISEALKRKEIERSEKWRKMAKSVKKGAHGEGMEFEFDIKNPKLIERTWKGVPDRWRSAAWWSFLDVSAKNDPESPTNEEVIASFHRLQEKPSPDDVQIDLDVPRTISRHVMFRRRYRGGQRLLFRVLHALSIYFPETGYVQGMASIGATLLCYFDEEKCFVMLVRMWQLRGLDQLYRHGFEGLMNALREFEAQWLHKEVANKLTEHCIDATAYGTRWYLTLFNLTIPFPAQLRVWDVFLLLGGKPTEVTETKGALKKAPPPSQISSTGLDILHATSAALIQALRDVLLDSDFENAMKTLTQFIPIKDEDLLMKVTKAEWKAHASGKKKA